VVSHYKVLCHLLYNANICNQLERQIEQNEKDMDEMSERLKLQEEDSQQAIEKLRIDYEAQLDQVSVSLNTRKWQQHT
jgi:hypothetical protein